MIRTFKILLALTIIFFLHRVESWRFLSEQYNGHGGSLWQSAITGALSDLWIATILTLPFWVFEFTKNRTLRGTQKFLGTLWVLMWGLLTASHQGYVEFFRFQIIPFHLAYLVDKSFISANGTSIFSTNSAVILALSAGLAYWTRRAKRFKKKDRVLRWLGAVIAISILGHVLNIRWRVNWFVIEPLQANYLEALYSNLGKKPAIKPLTEDDLTKFTQLTGQKSAIFPDLDPAKKNSSEYIAAVKAKVARRLSAKKPVILGIILAETFRDIDTGSRRSDGQSLTPILDRLRETGVTFSQVFSSGPVTRGGQEATWCGTPSATDTSLMRSFPDAGVLCIPELISDQQRFKSIWIHGGDERFDSQLSFWTRHKVGQFITKSDFPMDTPATGWGISDLALLDHAAGVLEEMATSKDTQIIFPMILTVTNHIPWAVPDDASFDTKSLITPHAAHRTIRYFDESLEIFVDDLKTSGLWDNSLFIVAGDHGNLELPWRDDDEKNPARWERMLSHISVTLTGGIVEELRTENKLPAVIDTLTAQNQIPAFLAEIAGISSNSKIAPQFMDAPLFEKSPWPVTSDLNQYLFLPEAGVKIPKEDIFEGNVDTSDQTTWIAATRYRAWLEFLYSSKPRH